MSRFCWNSPSPTKKIRRKMEKLGFWIRFQESKLCIARLLPISCSLEAFSRHSILLILYSYYTFIHCAIEVLFGLHISSSCVVSILSVVNILKMVNRLYQQLCTDWTFRWQQIVERLLEPKLLLQFSFFMLIILLLNKITWVMLRLLHDLCRWDAHLFGEWTSGYWVLFDGCKIPVASLLLIVFEWYFDKILPLYFWVMDQWTLFGEMNLNKL